MIKLLLISLLCAPGLPAAAQTPAPQAASTAPAPGSYDHGMQLRRKGEYAEAKEIFLKLLEQNPASGGALEGLALSCLSLKQYSEARESLERWNFLSPGSLYVLGFLARAQAAQPDDRAALATYKEIIKLSPENCTARGRVDSYMALLEPGFFPQGRAYKSRSIEGLDTPNPQHIIYEGSSAGGRFRAELTENLNLIGVAEIRKEAQRNAGRGFTYFEIQEQVYSAGLAGRRGRSFSWEAEYGQSIFSELTSPGSANSSRGRARLSGKWRSSVLDLASLPKLVRVSGGAPYYKLLRENSARVESGASLLDWDWQGRAGFSNISGGRTLGSLSLRGLREYGPNVFYTGYAHGQREFYSAAASGRLRYVHMDRLNASFSRGAQGSYRLGAGFAQSFYSDSNRLFETGGDLTAWLPWQKEFSGGYRYSYLDFLAPRSGYDSIDETGHWLTASWRRCAGRNWGAAAGYEHGFLQDSQVSYQANNYTAEAEWHSGTEVSVKLQGARKATTARGRSWSAGLQARVNF